MPLRRLLLLIALLLGLAFAGLAGRAVVGEWRNQERAARAQGRVAELLLALKAAEMVSRERGPTNGALGSAIAPSAEQLQALRTARERSDQALAALHGLPDPELVPALLQARSAVDALLARPLAQRERADIGRAVAAMVAVVPRLAPTISSLADAASRDLPTLNTAVTGARLVAELREYAGLLGSHFTAALARQQAFSSEERSAIERTRGRIDELRFLVGLQVQRAESRPEVRLAWQAVETRYFQVAMQGVGEVIAAGLGDGRYGLDPAAFAARYVPQMNTLFGLRDELMHQAMDMAQAESQRARRSLWTSAAAGTLLALLLAAAMRLLRRRLLKPLASLTQALHALARDDLAAPLPAAPADDEMAALIRAVGSLQQRSRERLALETERDRLIEQLRDLSSTDFLTGLPNRRAFFEAAQRELARARRQAQDVVLILLDIDHFKQFNDLHGHAAGDQALVAVARVLRDGLRAGDLVARYGGEEFVLLLGGCGREAGRAFAERLRVAIGLAGLDAEGRMPQRVTASLGLADSGRCGLLLETLLSQADAAMYRAKAEGRDRVRSAGDARSNIETDADPAG